MSVTVDPQSFQFVLFDASEIAAVATSVLQQLGMNDRNLRIEIDERTPVSRVRVELGDPIVVRAESGAFEDARRPRHFSHSNTALNLGRMLLRVSDRTNGTFDDAPDDGRLTLAEVAAWDTYIVGRLNRCGQSINRQRFVYNFRNRHGFTDASDAAFDQLWSAERLTWTALQAISNALTAAASAGTVTSAS